MSTVTLKLRQAPALRVDLRAIQPRALAGLTPQDVARLTVGHGNGVLALGDLFEITCADSATPALRLEGDLSRFDRIGWQLTEGRIDVHGSVGDYAGAAMTGGTMTVSGDAGALAACEMAGGTLDIGGNVGDFAASTLPGSMDGMRGGTFIVRGSAGARFGDRMRRGSALVFGDVGDFVASRMVAGTIAIGGRAGQHPGYGMRRGSVVFAGSTPALPVGFVAAGANADVFWQLLSRDLQRHGGPFSALAAKGIQRHLGDLSAAGKGEFIFPTSSSD